MERIQNLLPGGVAVRDRFGIWMKAATTRLAYVRLGAVFCLPILDDLDAVTSWTLGHSTSRSRFSSHYHLDHYNRERPHRALNGLAPLEFLAMMQEESAPQSHMC